MSLWRSYLEHRGRRTSKWPHYFTAYERHFSRFQNTAVNVLEIGCARGGSLQLWKSYFGPAAVITGVDIDLRCAECAEPQVTICIGDQGKPEAMDQILAVSGVPDIVIDDGSHKLNDILATFSAVYPRMSRTGVYVVEDLHTAYDPAFGGSFVEVCKGLIDRLNAHHIPDAVPNDFTLMTSSIHFYDSMVVFERAPHPKPAAPICVGRVGPPCHTTDLPEET